VSALKELFSSLSRCLCMKDLSLFWRPLETGDKIFLLALLAAYGVFVYWTWRHSRSPRQRAIFLAFRTAALALVLLVFLQPSAERGVRLTDVPVAVVVDRSESMAVPDAGADGKRRRWDEAVQRLGGGKTFLDELFAPDYFLLDRKLESLDGAALAKAEPKGPASDLSLLEDALRESPEARAILLFSDGRNGGGRDPLGPAARLGVPIYAFGVGKALSDPDLILDSVRAPHFAYKNTDVEVTVRVEKRNFDPAAPTVEIIHNGRAVASGAVVFSTGADAAEVSLRFQPAAKGLQTYAARVPSYADESNRKNNSKSFSMDVARDRMRVLYICGEPGPNYNFLRYQLKANPSVELVSFVILRDPEDVVNVPDQELSLIPFPSQDILFEGLRSFDLIVFEEFSFLHFGISPAAMAVLKEYVEKGGGLMLMGGGTVLGPSSPYRNTLIEPLLPVALDALRPGPQKFPLAVGEPGHPVLALADDPEESRRLWESMPALEGDGLFPARTRPGALTLAGAKTADGVLPVLAVWPRGKGRVMIFNNVTSWRWALLEAGQGRGTWAYQRFWNNLVRWMSASEDFRLVRLDVPSEAAASGSEVLVRAFVRDENYRPLAAGQVLATLKDPSGRVAQKTLKAQGNGEFAETFSVEEPGQYRVSAQAFVRRKKLGEDERSLRVGQAWEENRDTSTDFPLLDRLAKTSGGEFAPASAFTEKWVKERLEAAAWKHVRTEAVWNKPWVWASLVLLLLAEWFWRRKWGQL